MLFVILVALHAHAIPAPPKNLPLTLAPAAECPTQGATPAVALVQSEVQAMVDAAQVCAPERPPGTLDLQVEVGCDGRVSGVGAYDGSSWRPGTIACVMDAVWYTHLPAHSSTGGAVYTVSVSYGGDAAAAIEVDPAALAGVLEACRKGDSRACVEHVDLTLARDPNAAISCTSQSFASACDQQSHTPACAALGAAYLQRSEECFDARKGREILHLACTDEASPSRGCLALGTAYGDGLGGERDRTRAAHYYGWACLGGSGAACHAKGRLLVEGVGIRKDDEAALLSFQTGCELGDSPACLAAASLLVEGTAVAQNRPVAVDLYADACDADSGEGCLGLALLLEQGDNDPVGAREALEKAVALSHKPARRELARMLYNGIGGPKDKRQAKELCQAACQDGDAVACKGPAFL